MIFFPTTDEDFQHFRSQGYTGSLNDMHYKALGDLGHTGALSDRIHSFLVSEYGSFYESMRNLRNSSASFVALRYGVDTKQPALTLDFIREYFRTGGSKTTLGSAVTHAATTNATMTDSDGLLKWRPHNLVTYSEDFSNADWSASAAGTGVSPVVTANHSAAPDGNQTADRIEFDSGAAGNSSVESATITLIVGAVYTYSIWMRSLDSDVSITMFSNSATQNVTVTSVWQLFTFTVTAPATTNSVRIAKRDVWGTTGTADVLLWGAHLYRSDLGGMVNNPETGDSYVRTAGKPIGPEFVESTGQSGTITQTESSSGNPWWSVETSGQWSISANSLSRTSGGVWTSLRRDINMKASTTYELTCDVSNYITGNLYVYESQSTNVGTINSNGSHTVVFTTGTGGNSSILQLSSSNFDGTVGNISVKEVDVNPATERYLPRVGHHVYNGSDWVNEGLLHESEARTNSAPYSQDTSQWLEVGTSTITNQTQVAPDGTSTATLVDIGATGSSLGPNRISYTASNLTASSTATVSVYLKKPDADAASHVALRVYCPGTVATDPIVDYRTSDFTSASANAAVDAVHTSEDVGNGWYRVSFTFTLDASATGAWDLRVGGVVSGSITATGTDFIFWGAQLEQASTPSSYIPTSGSTVSRAAETLTVPAANMPWPKPVVIGPELITNGTFDTDISSWQDVSDAGGSISWNSSGYMDIVRVTGNARARQFIDVVQGKTYVFSLDIINPPNSGTIGINGTVVGQLNGLGTGHHEIVHTFTGPSGSKGVEVKSFNGTAQVDNISVKEVNPLALSIQMDGRMTYADTGVGLEVQQYRWQLNPTNYISTNIQTITGRTGQPIFSQRQSTSGLDGVAGTINVYNPDVNVPFNIAARHGSTFVNGAHEGTLLIADTTPTILPDLSSTDLLLGNIFMGTIGQFRMWSDDLGDAGIVEASAPSLEPSLSLTFDGSQTSFTVSDWSE